MLPFIFFSWFSRSFSPLFTGCFCCDFAPVLLGEELRSRRPSLRRGSLRILREYFDGPGSDEDKVPGSDVFSLPSLDSPLWRFPAAWYPSAHHLWSISRIFGGEAASASVTSMLPVCPMLWPEKNLVFTLLKDEFASAEPLLQSPAMSLTPPAYAPKRAGPPDADSNPPCTFCRERAPFPNVTCVLSNVDVSSCTWLELIELYLLSPLLFRPPYGHPFPPAVAYWLLPPASHTCIAGEALSVRGQRSRLIGG